MSERKVIYIYDGDTFVGRYGVSEYRRVQSVSVQFENSAISARIGASNEEFVARALLGELVRAKFATEEARSHTEGAYTMPT